jgi:6,7-dimethyl-8-ribityllumazine synthase
VSTSESWPGEESAVEEEVEELEEQAAEVDEDEEPEADDEGGAVDEDTGDEPQLRVAPASDLDVPDDIDLLEGEARDVRRGVGIVTARAHVEIANRLLGAALAELDEAGVSKEAITVMAVPGVFELPLGAMALAKTRRYSCIVALGCSIGDGLIAGEAASGLQLAALETGVPVAFGVLALETADEAEGREDAGAEAVRTALEMADLFAQLRASAAQG